MPSYVPWLDGNRRQKGDVIRKRGERAAKRKMLRAERAARAEARKAAGIVGAEIDWDLAVSAVADTSVEGVTRTIAWGGR